MNKISSVTDSLHEENVKEEKVKTPRSSRMEEKRRGDNKGTDQPFSPRLRDGRQGTSTPNLSKSKKKSNCTPSRERPEKSSEKKKREPPTLSGHALEVLFSYFSGYELLAAGMVSTAWRRLAAREKYWVELFRRNGWTVSAKKLKNLKNDLTEELVVRIYKNYYLKHFFVHINNWHIKEENGQTKKKIIDFFKKKIEARVVLMGLEGVGKTVSLYQLKLGEAIDSVPTVGVIEENIKYHKMVFEIIEIGGHEMLQKLWDQYLSTADAVLWMMDMSKKSQIAQSANELRKVDQILRTTEKPVLLCVLLNKTDLAPHLSPRLLSEQLNLEQLKFKKKYVQQLSSLNGDNELWSVIDWIYVHLPKLKEH